MDIEISSETTVENSFNAQRKEILASRQFVEMVPGASEDRDMGLIIVGNHYYLTHFGKFTQEEYAQLFENCAKNNDFTELGLQFVNFLEKRLLAYQIEHPDLPEEGDPYHPGKVELRNALEGYIPGKRRGIQQRKSREGRNPPENMGSPPLHEQPHWLLALDQCGMTMKQVYNYLEGENRKSTKPRIVVEGMINKSRQKEAGAL